MRFLVDGVVDPTGAHAVAALDLVAVGDRVTGEHVRIRGAAVDLIGEPAVVELGEELVGVPCELRDVDRVLGVDLRLQLGRPVVGVHEPVDVLPEPQSEDEVALRLAHRSNRAACP